MAGSNGKVASERPRSEHSITSGSVQGAEPTPDERTSPATVQRFIERFYGAAQGAVKAWGGSASLASFWGCAESNVSHRLNRKEVNGTLNYAFLDFAAIACTKPAAAEQFLFALCDLFGFEHPRRNQIKTVDEKFRGLVKSLRQCGPLGEAAIRKAAADIGADPSEFEP